MTTDLTQLMEQGELDAMLRSWAAYSATNIVFGPDGRLLLGVLSKSASRTIPEPGDLVLIGGFNTLLPGNSSFAEVATAHAMAQLGIVLMSGQCSDFLPCEFPMAEITAPLMTPYGPMFIKRIAFERVVVLNGTQVSSLQPQGKLRDVVWLTSSEFEDMIRKSGISFPYEIEYVRMAFEMVNQGYLREISALPAERRAMADFKEFCVAGWS